MGIRVGMPDSHTPIFFPERKRVCPKESVSRQHSAPFFYRRAKRTVPSFHRRTASSVVPCRSTVYPTVVGSVVLCTAPAALAGASPTDGSRTGWRPSQGADTLSLSWRRSIEVCSSSTAPFSLEFPKAFLFGKRKVVGPLPQVRHVPCRTVRHLFVRMIISKDTSQ